MKKTLLSLALVVVASVGYAQTNSVTVTNVVTLTNTVSALAEQMEQAAPAKEYGGYELTFSAGGAAFGDEDYFGLDVSLSSNPFEKLPNLWLGVSQGIYWEPSFAGATDLFADWNTHLFGELYVNTGWSAGVVYDKSTSYFRHGPEVSFEYYLNGGSTFLIAGANWRFNESGSGVKDGLDYTFGIGLAF